MATYTIEVLQIVPNEDGTDRWLGPFDGRAFSLKVAKQGADADFAAYLTPRRVVNQRTGEVIYSQGDTPAWREHQARVLAVLAEEKRLDALPPVVRNARLRMPYGTGSIRTLHRNGQPFAQFVGIDSTGTVMEVTECESVHVLREIVAGRMAHAPRSIN